MTNWMNKSTIYIFLFLIVILGGNPVYASSVGNKETEHILWQQNYANHTDKLQDVAYGNGIYVAVGGEGAVLLSTDGSTWKTQPTGMADSIERIMYDGERFYGLLGWQMVQSSNGLDWSLIWTSEDCHLNEIVTNGKTIVAVGSSFPEEKSFRSRFVTSQDGGNWSTEIDSDMNSLEGVVWNGESFVALASGGRILVSKDGGEWITLANLQKNALWHIRWLNGQYLILGSESFVSKDGIHWQALPWSNVSDVIWDGTNYIGIGRFGHIELTSNLAKWEVRVTIPQKNTLEYTRILFAGNRYVAVGEGEQIAVSTDLKTWARGSDPEAPGIVWLSSAAWNGYEFVLSDINGTVYTSENGIDVQMTAQLVSPMYDIVWDGNRFVAGGDNGTVGISKDARSWTYVQLPKSVDVRRIAYGNSIYVAISYDGDIFQSVDAEHWTISDSSGQDKLLDLTYSGTEFMIAGYNSILRSEDGLQWSFRKYKLNRNFDAISCSPETCVLVGYYGLAMTSDDRVNWTEEHDLPTREAFESIVWNGKYFTAVGVGGRVMVSEDGRSWSLTERMNDTSYDKVIWNGESMLMVGHAGSIVRARPSDIIVVQLDGSPIIFDHAPFVEEGTTLVPLRKIFEKLGARVEWNQETQTVTAVKGSIQLHLTVNSNAAWVNEEECTLDVPMKMVNGQTMVPLRFISEAFGAKIEWNGDTHTVNITS